MQLVAEAKSHSDTNTKSATLFHRDGMGLAMEQLAMELVLSTLEMLLLGLAGHVWRPVDKALGKLSHLALNRGDDMLHGLAPLLVKSPRKATATTRMIFSGGKTNSRAHVPDSEMSSQRKRGGVAIGGLKYMHKARTKTFFALAVMDLAT